MLIDSYEFFVRDFLSQKLAIICKREDISNKMLTSSKDSEVKARGPPEFQFLIFYFGYFGTDILGRIFIFGYFGTESLKISG